MKRLYVKYFTYEYKKACNLFKWYLLPKIHKRLFNVPGRPVISSCGTPTEKVSEFLDHHLKPIMQNRKDFLEKIKTVGSVPENAILVTADVVGLYPNIPHQAGLKDLKEALEKRDTKQIPTEDLVITAKFVLNNFLSLIEDVIYNIFEFNKRHINKNQVQL